jgi:hypothetical protein
MILRTFNVGVTKTKNSKASKPRQKEKPPKPREKSKHSKPREKRNPLFFV